MRRVTLNRKLASSNRSQMAQSRWNHTLVRCTVATRVVTFALTIGTLAEFTTASETIYNNLDGRHNGELFLPGHPPEFFDLFAQPIELDDNNSISSVSLRLARWDGTNGPVSGPWRFSIWDDAGNGRPGQRVGELGTVDVGELPNIRPNPPAFLDTIVLDSSVAGLTPSATYYIVGDIREIDGVGGGDTPFRRDTVILPFLSKNTGTRGAESLWVSASETGVEWQRHPLLGRRWLQMSVDATTTAPANDPLFDNLVVPTEHYVNVTANDRRHAQQFLMNNRVSLEEVTVSLSRQGVASGSMTFEIWNDTGAGAPMEKVANLGTVEDVSQIPTTHTEYTFDHRVIGLDSNEEYWVVANYSGLTGALDPENSIGWTVVLSDDGANGAAQAYGSVDSGATWFDLAERFGVDSPFKFKMSVVGGNFGDFDEDGAFTAADIDTLAASIRDGSGNPRFDLNEDRSVDSADHDFWVKDLKNTWYGDANLDGEFNSADMVAVFQSGKYEFDEEAGWAQGDWTGDRRFDSGDMVAAFQDGGYELGTRATVNAVPEPSCVALLVVGAIGVCWLRMRRNC